MATGISPSVKCAKEQWFNPQKPPPNDRSAALRLHPPTYGGAGRKKCRDGKADQSPGLVHFARRIPAAHREQAVHIEPTEKAPPCLDRIKAVLGERESSR